MRNPLYKLILLIFTGCLALGACSTPAAVPSTLSPTSPAITTAAATSAAAMVIPTPTETAAPAAVETSAVPASQISLTDGLGRTITLKEPAQKIVSMAPSNTEILYAIGAGQQVVGRDEFSDYPTEAKNLPSVGGSFAGYSNEAIVNLKPDLVLAAEINTKEQVQALEKLGLTVYYLSNPVDLDGMYKNLGIVAKLTGHEAEANQLVESLKKRVEAVSVKTAQLSTMPQVFYELDNTDPNAPYTAGPGTFIDTLIGMAGGHNVGGALKTQYAQISVEELLVQNPQIILLGDGAYGVTVDSVKKRAGWEKIDAVKDGQIYTFDDNLVSRPGPRLVDGLEILAKLLHPELFK
jgi:iron complex transport system substrate-binding protein